MHRVSTGDENAAEKRRTLPQEYPNLVVFADTFPFADTLSSSISYEYVRTSSDTLLNEI